MFSKRKRSEFRKWFANDVSEYLKFKDGIKPDNQRTWHSSSQLVSRYGESAATLTNLYEHAIEYSLIGNDISDACVFIEVLSFSGERLTVITIPAIVFCSPYFNSRLLFQQVDEVVESDWNAERKEVA